MELMADLVCNFIRQRAEADAGQGHAFSVFIKFFRLQLGVAGIPDKEEVFVFHQSQFLGNGLCLRRFTKGYYIKQLKMDCQPTEFTALSRHRAVFSWAGKGGIPICGA